jgi:hypothetical protein
MSGIVTSRNIRFATLDDPVSADFLEDTTRDIQRELDTLDGLKTTAMKRPVAIIHTNGVTVPVTTLTTVQFSTEDVDTHAMVDLTTNNQRITVSSTSGAGLYYVTAHSQGFSSGSWTMGEFTLRKNGGGVVRRKYYNFNGNTTVRMALASVVYLGAVADYVDVQVYHEGGATDDIGITYLKAFKITT